MQIPFFNGELPEYANYGGFGSTAGHELTHGFDDNGAKYDDTVSVIPLFLDITLIAITGTISRVVGQHYDGAFRKRDVLLCQAVRQVLGRRFEWRKSARQRQINPW